MLNKIWIVIFMLILPRKLISQENSHAIRISPEFMIGYINKSNENFPERKFKKQINLNFGKTHQDNPQEWAQRLSGIETGISFSFSDFGNDEKLGKGFTVLPFIDFPLLKSNRFNLQSGLGISYHTRKFHPEKNPHNQAISTSFTWAYRLYVYYSFWQTDQIDWKIGGGYAHHSNGHTRLRNQGLNSFLVGISADLKSKYQDQPQQEYYFENSNYTYLSLRSGLGRNVLATAFNDRKNVYAFSVNFGKVYNHTWKIGAGAYYHFYEHYYQYIKNDYFLVQPDREFQRFKKSPRRYASNFGLMVQSELLLNHIGIELGVGLDLYKPAYKLDWRMNGGWLDTPIEIPENWQVGEYSFYFKLKYRISGRLGLKYYLFETHTHQPFNLFVGAFINSNLGQADFSELGVGYIYNFALKK